MNINTMTFAARDFSARRGASDEHIPKWICEERATKSGRKRPAALWVAPNLACGFVARRLQPHGRGCALLTPRHRPNWAQRTTSYLCLRPLRKSACSFFRMYWDPELRALWHRTESADKSDALQPLRAPAESA